MSFTMFIQNQCESLDFAYVVIVTCGCVQSMMDLCFIKENINTFTNCASRNYSPLN